MLCWLYIMLTHNKFKSAYHSKHSRDILTRIIPGKYVWGQIFFGNMTRIIVLLNLCRVYFFYWIMSNLNRYHHKVTLSNTKIWIVKPQLLFFNQKLLQRFYSFHFQIYKQFLITKATQKSLKFKFWNIVRLKRMNSIWNCCTWRGIF